MYRLATFQGIKHVRETLFLFESVEQKFIPAWCECLFRYFLFFFFYKCPHNFFNGSVELHYYIGIIDHKKWLRNNEYLNSFLVSQAGKSVRNILGNANYVLDIEKLVLPKANSQFGWMFFIMKASILPCMILCLCPKLAFYIV